MSTANTLRVTLSSVLLALTPPVLAKDLLIVNVEAIKQAAMSAILDAHPEVFDDDLLVEARQHNLTLICMPDRFLEEATSVDQYVRRCNASFRFLLRDSIELQPFVDEDGNCYERRTAVGFSVSVYSDGTTQLGEIAGQGRSTTWIDCGEMLHAAGAKPRESAHRMVRLEVVPGMADLPPGPGLFHVDVAGIKSAAAKAVNEAYPEYSDGGLLPDDTDKPMLVPCHSIVDPTGDSAVPGAHLCFAHVDFRIAESVESAPFLADDGTCRVASKYLGVKVAIGEDGVATVGRPGFGCGGNTGGDIVCDTGPDVPREADAFDDWCQPGERQVR